MITKSASSTATQPPPDSLLATRPLLMQLTQLRNDDLLHVLLGVASVLTGVAQVLVRPRQFALDQCGWVHSKYLASEQDAVVVPGHRHGDGAVFAVGAHGAAMPALHPVEDVGRVLTA